MKILISLGRMTNFVGWGHAYVADKEKARGCNLSAKTVWMHLKYRKMDEVRIDKWLWAVRIFKTRSIATQACKMNRVTIGNQPAKPSRCVKVGDVISVKKPPVLYSFEVLALSQSRMGAKHVPNYMRNVTPPDQYEILEMSKVSGFVDRAKGLGRPTKRDRREMEQFGASFQRGENQFNYLAGGQDEIGIFDWDEDSLAEADAFSGGNDCRDAWPDLSSPQGE